MTNLPESNSSDFIRDKVREHIAEGRYPGIVTRFPPEPNGYLHIGHAKSICLNFGIARDNQGICNLRMDDTNPVKEDVEYVDSIVADVYWLIDGWADHCLGLKKKASQVGSQQISGRPDVYMGPAEEGEQEKEPFFASDYFDQLYGYAEQLILKG